MWEITFWLYVIALDGERRRHRRATDKLNIFHASCTVKRSC
jgi:hypothetical protein